MKIIKRAASVPLSLHMFPPLDAAGVIIGNYSGILSAEKIQSLYENGSEAVTDGRIEYQTKLFRRGMICLA